MLSFFPFVFTGGRRTSICIHFRRSSAQGYRSKSDHREHRNYFYLWNAGLLNTEQKVVYPHPLFTTRPTTATAYRPPRGTQLAIYSTSSNRYLDVCVVNGAVGRFDDGDTHFGV